MGGWYGVWGGNRTELWMRVKVTVDIEYGHSGTGWEEQWVYSDEEGGKLCLAAAAALLSPLADL